MASLRPDADVCQYLVLTVGSFIPCIFYGFFCDPLFQACHLLAIAFAGACKYSLAFNEHSMM